MKRVLIFFLCFLVILPLVFVCSSAYDPRDGAVRAIPNDPSGYPYLYTFAYEPSVSGAEFFPFYSNGTQFYGAYLSASLNLSYYTNSEATEFLRVYTNGEGWIDDSYRFLYFSSPVSSLSGVSFLRDNEYNSLSPLVGTALHFGGQVLDFIVSTEGILSLLGLSIALFLIVPFSIRKIKDFVKGY